MVKGLILEGETFDYYTNLNDVFAKLNNLQNNYNWLITNYECSIYPDNRIPYDKDYVLISGEELTDIVSKHEIQFRWGVFTAFEKNISKEEILKYPLPYADGNTKLWQEKLLLQHPLSKAEIIAWDSSCAILISENSQLLEQFKAVFPAAQDLSEYNRR